MSKELERNPEIIWRDEPDQKDLIVMALENGGDAEGMGWVVLVDGGDIHQLNLIAGEIWLLCDGTRDEAAIAAEISRHYEAPVEEIIADVDDFVAECINKGWIFRKD